MFHTALSQGKHIAQDKERYTIQVQGKRTGTE